MSYLLQNLQFRFSSDDTMIHNSENNNCDTDFDDLNFYISLCRTEGCVKVDISNVQVRHNDFCQGIKTIYELVFIDGSTRTVSAPWHVSSYGYYAYTGRDRVSTLSLLEGEYIRGLSIRQGEIVDRITFVTNLREFHCGGSGGSVLDSMIYPEHPKRKVIAFAGRFDGVLGRVGFHAKSDRWENLRVYILLRWLVDNDQANEIEQSKNNNDHDNGDVSIRWLLNKDTSRDILVNVLSFVV